MLPFSLCNAVETVGHLVVSRMPPSTTNDKFVGVERIKMPKRGRGELGYF